MSRPHITVVGSINLDMVASAAKLPAPGETVTGATLARHPGGKGANQALAAQRLGADVQLIGCVGKDTMAGEALAMLRADGVDLKLVETDPVAPTGVALIAVAPDGENLIVVAPGANMAFTRSRLLKPVRGAMICQLELPIETVEKAVEQAGGFVAVNLAPAADVPASILKRADLLVVNEVEAAFYGDKLHAAPGLVAITRGKAGASLYKGGEELASATPPTVNAVDATGAGDAFVGALVVALLEKQPHDQALRFACTAGALAAAEHGAQPSLPYRADVDDILE